LKIGQHLAKLLAKVDCPVSLFYSWGNENCLVVATGTGTIRQHNCI